VKRDDMRKRRFRSYTVNFASAKARTTIITMGISLAMMAIIIGVVAVQLIAGNGNKGLAGRILHSISAHTLSGVISNEIPMYASVGPAPTMAETTVYPKGVANLLLYLFSDIDAGNPMTVLSTQLPGMAMSDFQLVTPDPQYDTPPADHSHEKGEQPNINAKPREKKDPVKPVSDEPVVFLYHSHNREAFMPDMGITEPNKAYDAEKNIEKAGSWMLDGLKKEGFPVLQTLEDYWTKGDFDNAYDYSRPTVQKVLKEHHELKLIFDIHRDSLPRDKTTRVINGQNYASVYWIVGGGNPKADKNEALATKLNEYMKILYPDLSRGVWRKPANPAYDTRYNQDLDPHMVLIEVGGPGNSLEEVKRTSEALAKVVTNYLKDVENLSPKIKEPGQTPAQAAANQEKK
jgi:stage II sporulation protein P